MVPVSSISGRILNANRAPVGGSTVVLLQPRNTPTGILLLPPGSRTDWVPGDAVTPGAQAVTDDRGTYRLFNLESGEYYIGVWPDVEPASHRRIIRPAQYYPGSIDPTTAVSLSPGVELTGLDIQLSTRTLYSAKFKTVGAECPLPEALKMFHIVRRPTPDLQVTQGFALFRPTDVTSLQQSGDRWETSGLYPGTYDFYYSSCYAVNGPLDSGHLTVHIVDRNVDVGVMALRASVPITGRVVLDSSIKDSVDVQKLVLRLIDLNGRSTHFLPFSGNVIGAPPFVPASDGTFRLPYVAAGKYTLNILQLPRGSYLASIGSGGRDVRDTGIDIGEDQQEPLVLTIAGPGGSVEGVVVDGKQRPVPNAEVLLLPGERQRANATLFRSILTDQSGAYSFIGVVPGDYSLAALDVVVGNRMYNQSFISTLVTRATKVHVERASTTNITAPLISIK
jgi:hypothetical protein